jgi:hypothetical protein
VHWGSCCVLLVSVGAACAAPAPGPVQLERPVAASSASPAQAAVAAGGDSGTATAPPVAMALRLEAIAPTPAPAPAPLVEIKSPILAQQIPLPKLGAYLVRLKVENWPLAANGAGVEIALDDQPPRRVLDEKGIRLASLTADEREPKPGEHALVVWAIRASGELVRPAAGQSRAPVAAVRFWAGEAGGPVSATAPPRLVSPRGTLNGDAAAESALVDFLPQNLAFGAAAPPLRVKLQGVGAGAPPSAAELTLDAWQPVAIRGLASGDWLITVEQGTARAERVISVNRDLAPTLVR